MRERDRRARALPGDVQDAAGWRLVARTAGPMLLFAALLAGREDQAPAIVLVVLAIVVAHLGFLAPAVLAGAIGLVERLARWFGAGVTWLVDGLVFALIVVPVATLLRLARADPLGRRSTSRTSWLGGSRNDTSFRPFALEGARRTRTRGAWRARTLVAVAVGMLAVFGTTWFGFQKRPLLLEVGGFTYSPYAHEHEPFAHDLFNEQAIHPDWVYDLVAGYRNRDFSGRFMQIRDRERRSYEPPGRQLVVWFFGGSTLFGLGQRDDRTIPSEVARIEAARGHAVEVHNFGVSGYVTWQQAQLLDFLLTTRRAPDLVVFYGGANDFAAQTKRAAEGSRDYGDPEIYVQREWSQALARGRQVVDDPQPVNGGPGSVAQQGARTYSEALQLVRAAGRAYRFGVLDYWQPDLSTKAPDSWDTQLLERSGRPDPRLYLLMESQVTPRPIDLTKALDGLAGPVLTDPVHTNEEGARAVAQAMIASIEHALNARHQTR